MNGRRVNVNCCTESIQIYRPTGSCDEIDEDEIDEWKDAERIDNSKTQEERKREA